MPKSTSHNSINMTAATLPCDAGQKRERAVLRAAELLNRGGLVVFPTETVYGVAAAANNPRGLKRLRELKQRGADKPFTIHIASPEDANKYIDLENKPQLRRLIRKTMPGPITIVAEVEPNVIHEKLAALGLTPDDAHLLYYQNSIGLRCPDQPIANQMLAAVQNPVVASSANEAGQPPPTRADLAHHAIGRKTDLILDGGEARFAQASTIVKVSLDGTPKLLRQGVFDQQYLERLMRRVILFVCSGNTCRSPMAESIARFEAAKALNIAPDALADHDIDIISAGAFALPGAPMTPEAEAALQQLNIPHTPHAARQLTTGLINQADVILCMTEGHRLAVTDIAPDSAHKAQLLDTMGDIDDPIGGSLDVYLQCAQRMQQAIGNRLGEIGITSDSN